MDPILTSVQEYIKSGEYYTDARKWYNFKYISPVIHRSFLLLFAIVFLILLSVILININSVLPIVRQIRYAISSNSFQSSAIIHRANKKDTTPLSAIADIMVRNYLIHRESYDYDRLKNQFMFIQNNSTRIIFKQFANYMNIDNPVSPVMRYQKAYKRAIEIISVTYNRDDEAVVKFQSVAQNNLAERLEKITWQAVIGFQIDPIRQNLPVGSKFNFAVTNYKLKLLEDKSKK